MSLQDHPGGRPSTTPGGSPLPLSSSTGRRAVMEPPSAALVGEHMIRMAFPAQSPLVPQGDGSPGAEAVLRA